MGKRGTGWHGKAISCAAALAMACSLNPAVAWASPDSADNPAASEWATPSSVGGEQATAPQTPDGRTAGEFLADIASGTWGTCRWTIDGAGALSIGAGTGASTVDAKSPWAAWVSKITSVRTTGKVVAPRSIAGLFGEMGRASSIDLSGFDTSSTTDFHSLFYNCESLVRVNVSSFDTSKATLLDGMFSGCRSLPSVDVSHFDTENTLHFEYFFDGCASLSSLDLSNFDTSNAEHLKGMFQNCSRLTSLDLSNFETPKNSYLENMFLGCSSLERLDISGFDTSRVIRMSDMFSGCASLAVVKVGKKFSFKGSGDVVLTELPSYSVKGRTDWYSINEKEWFAAKDIAAGHNNVYTTYRKDYAEPEADPNPGEDNPGAGVAHEGMWGSCSWAIDESGVLTVGAGVGTDIADYVLSSSAREAPWAEFAADVRSVRFDGVVRASDECCNLFKDLENVESIDLSGLDLSRTRYIGGMFNGCRSLKTLDVSMLDMSSVVNANHLFANCSSLESVNLTGLDTRNLRDMGDMFRACTKLASVDLSGLNTSRVTYMGDMFYSCASLRTVDLSVIDMSANMSLSEMFSYCTSLRYVNFKGLDTSRVTRMDSLFSGCTSLVKADFQGIDTSNVSNIESLFNGCTSLVAFDADSLDTSAVTNMAYLFVGCTSLESLDLSGWDTSRVTNMQSAFQSMHGLRSINLSGWDTSSVTNMQRMFYDCCRLTSIDLSMFDTSKVQNMSGMFGWDTYLQRIDISSFDTANAQNMADAFVGCGNLEALRVGAGFSFWGAAASPLCSLPERFVGPDADSWYSSADGVWGTSESFSWRHGGMATTYQASASVPELRPAPTERAEGDKEPVGWFSDVDYFSWYADAVVSSAAMNLVSGYDGTTLFGVGDSLTREQFAVILWRYAEPEAAKATTYPANSSGLSDVEGGRYYTAAVNWAVSKGIITGYSDSGRFGVGDALTFEQMVTIIARASGEQLGSDLSALSRYADADSLSNYAKAAVAWATREGLVSGYDEGGVRYLRAGEDVARERSVVVLVNAIDKGML